MIRNTEASRSNQPRNTDRNISRQDQLHQYDHLIPPMKKLLKFTAKATWWTVKNLVKAAWHLPGLVRKLAEHNNDDPKPNRGAMPSPPTAFPAP